MLKIALFHGTFSKMCRISRPRAWPKAVVQNGLLSNFVPCHQSPHFLIAVATTTFNVPEPSITDDKKIREKCEDFVFIIQIAKLL